MREKTKAYKSLPFGVVLWERLRKVTKSKAVSSNIKRNTAMSSGALKWQRELASWSGWNSSKIDENNYEDEFDFEVSPDAALIGSTAYGGGETSATNTLASLSEQVSNMFMSPPLGNLSSLSYYPGPSPPANSPSRRRYSGSNAGNEHGSFADDLLGVPTHDEVARSLTDLQKHMLRIVRDQNGSASLDDIVEGIQKHRDLLRKRDGSLYAIDCRRAVAATLAKTSFNSSLFVRDEENDGYWRFGPLAKVLNLDLLVIGDGSKSPLFLDEPPSKKRRGSSHNGRSGSSSDGESSSSNISSPLLGSRYVRRVPGTRRTQLRLYAPGKGEVESLHEEEEDNDVDDYDEDEEALDRDSSSDDSRRETPQTSRKRVRKPKDDSTPETDVGSPLIFPSLETNDSSELTPLQIMMIEALNKNGGSAQLSTVYKYVSKRWGNLRRRDEMLQNVDCKTAVKSCLAASGRSMNPLFEPDPLHDGQWKVTRVGIDLCKAAKEKKERKQQQQQAQKSKESSEEQPKLTDMQDMLMKIITMMGGAATFEQIFTEVTTNWKTKWDTDCKRALLASLSHNPPGNFKKNKEGQWTIAPKALGLVNTARK